VGGDHTTGTWKPFVDRVHAKGLAFGLHLMHGKLALPPRLAVNAVVLSIYPTNRFVTATAMA